MKKRIIFLVLTIFLLWPCFTMAKTLTQEVIPNVWIFRKGGGQPAFSSKYTNYTIDGKTAYCIEPGMHINSDEYSEDIGLSSSPYDDETNKLLQLIGYYGYDYPGHNTLHFRMATQALIWEVTGGQTVEYWTEKSGGGTFISVKEEKNEIMRLVNKALIIPKFDAYEKEGNIGEEIIFYDENNALGNYTIDYSTINVQMDGNKIITSSNNVGLKEIRFKPYSYTNNPTTIFISSDPESQKMAYFGYYKMDVITLKINFHGGKVTINKSDDCNTKKFFDIKFGLYYQNHDELIEYLTINNDNTITNTKELNYGYYYIKEISAPDGFTIDSEKHYFQIEKDNLFPVINIKNKRIKNEINVYKVLNIFGLPKESNVEFEIIDAWSKEVIASKVTDENGHFSITLPYGDYIIRQLTTTPGFDVAKDELIQVRDDSITQDITIKNNLISSQIKVIKMDSETNDIIKKDGFKFRIKNMETNEYVSEGETKEGVFITKLLPFGNYELEEVDSQIEGYEWNKEKIKFSIGEESNPVIEILFYNNPIKEEPEIIKEEEVIIPEVIEEPERVIVPNTLSMSNNYYLIINYLLFSVGIIYGKKKKV